MLSRSSTCTGIRRRTKRGTSSENTSPFIWPSGPRQQDLTYVCILAERANRKSDEIFQEVLSGIKTYFDKCLGNLLLYRFERQQYVDIRKRNTGKEDSEIYGGEHLLRLFGRWHVHTALGPKDVDDDQVNAVAIWETNSGERVLTWLLCVISSSFSSSIPHAYRSYSDGSGLDQCSPREPGGCPQVSPGCYGVVIVYREALYRMETDVKDSCRLSIVLFPRWMQKNHKELLLSEYENASPAYQSIVKS